MIKLSWMKFYVDFFDDARIQVIETMPDADALYAIWFKLLAFVGKQNSSGVFLIHTGGQADDLPITEEVISTVTHRPITTVRLALTTFERLGLIERLDGVYAFTNWDRLVDEDRLRRLEARREQKALDSAVRAKSKKELVRAYATEHPGASQREIARKTGVSLTSVNRYLKSFKNLPPSHQTESASSHEASQVFQNDVPSVPNGCSMERSIEHKSKHQMEHQNPQVNSSELVFHSKKEIKKEDIDKESSSSDTAVAVDNPTGKRADSPTLSEVRAFCSEQKLRIDPDHFFDVNEERGWVTKTGKPVDDWKGLAVTWDRHQTSPAPSAASREKPSRKRELPSVEEVMRDYHCDRVTAEGILQDPFF